MGWGTRLSSIVAPFSEGFLLGLATGTSCLAVCGPVYAPFLMQFSNRPLRSLLVLLEISAGRFIPYIAVGALAGLLGAALETTYRFWFTFVAYLGFSFYLIITALTTHRREKCCSVGKWQRFTERPLILGVLTGINVCPSFLLAFSRAVESSGVAAGILFFTAFFVGTTIFLLPLSFLGLMGQKKNIRIIARFIAVGVGVWFILQAALMLKDRLVEQYNVAHDTRAVVQLMDSTEAAILVPDTATVPSVLKLIKNERIGATTLVTDTAALPVTGYLFITHAEAEELGAAMTLKKPGRFLCIVDEPAGDTLSAAAEERKMVDYLKFYSFWFEVDSGTVYWLGGQ